MQKKHIIIGGGLSGLSCASVLGDDCIVLEQDYCVGGLAKTVLFRDFSFDLGGHRFFAPVPRLQEFFRGILGDSVREVKRRSRIFRNNQFIEYPLNPSVIKQLPCTDTVRALATYCMRNFFPLPGRSFEDAAKNRFGDRLYELFFKEYTAKVWGIPCSGLSTEFFDARLASVSLRKAILHAFSFRQDLCSFTDTFLYPACGIGEFSRRLGMGRDVRLQQKVTGFVHTASRIEKVITNNHEEIPCVGVVSTMPVPHLVEALHAPLHVQQAVRRLRYRSLVCVFLVLNRRMYTPDHWIYFPGKQIFGRLHEPKNWSSNMAPADKTGICVEIFCDQLDAIWNMDDSRIAHEVISEVPLLNRFEVVAHMVKRVAYAYPVYTIGYRKDLDMVRSFVSSFRNLFLVGRTGNFQYINMDACIDEGMRLGARLKSAHTAVNACPK
ncbi:MAG TPA: FAD-dependent oxidoreductase [Candidatus Omnitrophota bacterium]|nr:FAD-dependent oxidoreductase [Candidatus Omnitrophota bacterium]